MNEIVYAFCGYKRSGKDTCGKLMQEIDPEFVRISYAGILKDVLSSMFSWERHLLEGGTIESEEFRNSVDQWWSEKLNIPNLTPRFMLQYFGTDIVKKNLKENFWALCVERLISRNKKVVITDLRFPDEVEMLDKYNSYIIRVKREIPSWEEDARIALKSGNYEASNFDNTHISEVSFLSFDYDYVIDNTVTKDELKERLRGIHA